MDLFFSANQNAPKGNIEELAAFQTTETHREDQSRLVVLFTQLQHFYTPEVCQKEDTDNSGEPKGEHIIQRIHTQDLEKKKKQTNKRRKPTNNY